MNHANHPDKNILEFMRLREKGLKEVGEGMCQLRDKRHKNDMDT